MTARRPEQSDRFWSALRLSVLPFVLLTVVAVGVLGIAYSTQRSSRLAALENDETHATAHQEEALDILLRSITSDVRGLASRSELLRYLDTGDTANLTGLADEFLSFSDVSGLYDQIRFLDETGMELVRVDANDGAPAIVPEDELQFKGDRYYFTEALAVGEDELYVSPFDLNVEQGEVEQPWKPMIRFGIPVSDSTGTKRGVVLVNYYGADLVDGLTDRVFESAGELMLLNSKGYWLYGAPSSEDAWGFMFDDKQDRSFANSFPSAWQEISTGTDTQFQTSDGMFTFEAFLADQLLFEQMGPTGHDHEAAAVNVDSRWRLVSFVSADFLATESRNQFMPFFAAFLLLELLIAAGSWLSALLKLSRRRAAAEAKSAEDRNRELLDSIGAVLIVIAPDGDRIVHWNPVSEATFGIPFDRTIGRSIEECEVPCDKDMLRHALNRCRDESSPQTIEELPYTRANGDPGFLSVTLRPIEAMAGDSSHVLLMASDVTERRALEAQLAQAQKLESIGQLAAGIAHEINTPAQYVGDNLLFLQQSFGDLEGLLTKYRTLQAANEAGHVPAELISEIGEAAAAADIEFLGEEIPEALTESREGIARVTKIVRAMKEFSHPGSVDKQPADLNRAIESTITVASNEWKYVADVETDFDPELPLVPCLVGEFNQVIMNLLVNAAQALAEAQPEGGREKGTIHIRTGLDGTDWATIEVSDTGPGMPEEVRTRVFDPFFTTKDVGKGTGQGLAIAHSVLVDKHGGTIEVTSEVGQGTTFHIRLPLRPADERAEELV